MTLTATSVLLALTLTFVSIAYAQEASQPDPVDIKGRDKELAATIRDLTARAKDGIPAVQLEKEVLQIQNTASDLLAALPENATDCEIRSVVKTAAAGVGSHEVLKLLTANDAMAVLDGRLALSLAVLDQMAQQLRDELTLSEDVGSILAAIVFATKTTVDIVEAADATVNEVLYQPQGGSDDAADKAKDGRRQSWDLGSGWNVGLGGLSWQSSSGNANFNVKPTFGGGGLGVKAGFTFRF